MTEAPVETLVVQAHVPALIGTVIMNALCAIGLRFGLKVAACAAIACLAMSVYACDRPVPRSFGVQPALEVHVAAVPHDIRTSDGVLLVVGNDVVWFGQWSELPTMTQHEYSSSGYAAWVGSELVYAVYEKGDRVSPIVRRNMATGELTTITDMGEEWYCGRLRNSDNGEWAVIWAKEEINVTDNVDAPNMRFGFIDAKQYAFVWVATIPRVREDDRPGASSVAISNDGKYVAVAGINGKGGWTCVMDTGKKAVLWEGNPDHSISFADVCFSPDGARMYTGGGSGRLYCFDTQNGELLSEWTIGEGPEPEYGHRMTRVSASPDGRLVAAGTGPKGTIYVWDATSGTRVMTIDSNDATITGLAFSPDSKRLASSGVYGRAVRIWDVGRVKGNGEEGGRKGTKDR